MGEPRGVINDVPERLRAFAKTQRSTMTRAEALFWTQVRAGRLSGHKFKRQVPVVPFIVDFMCVAARLVVELDGPPHESADARAKDRRRDAWLLQQGFRVMRFSNEEVLGNCDLVMHRVLEVLSSPSPAPLCGAPSPSEGERVGARQRPGERT